MIIFIREQRIKLSQIEANKDLSFEILKVSNIETIKDLSIETVRDLNYERLKLTKNQALKY